MGGPLQGMLIWFQSFRPWFEPITVIASLLAIVTWSIAIPLILWDWWRGRGIRVEFSVAGLRAAALFGGAKEQWAARNPEKHPRNNAGTVARTLARAFEKGRSRLSGKRILWVDDEPNSVSLEIEGFEALGAAVVQRSTTEAALQSLGSSKFDLIISDMGRPPDNRAGYSLLQSVREKGSRVPFLIYSGSNRPEHVNEAIERGAQGATNDPEELLKLAINQI